MGTPLVLDVRGLTTQWPSASGPLTVVNDVSFSLAPGHIMGLVGESGSGKSMTGFSIMGLIDRPGSVTGGEVWFQDRSGERVDLRQLPERALRALRGNRLAMVFQDPMMTLNPVLRIDTQMVETIRAHHRVSPRAARAQAERTLALVGIPSPKERLNAYPHQFSGGMRQRVAIAIALLNEPDLLIADEPTTALDVTIQAQILAEVQNLCRQSGTALVWITHDLSVVAGLADSVAVMYAGRLVEQGPVNAVLDRPAHPYTRGLMASLPSRNPRGQPLNSMPGMAPSLAHLPAGCAFAPRCPASSGPCLTQVPNAQAVGHAHQTRCWHPVAAGSPLPQPPAVAGHCTP